MGLDQNRDNAPFKQVFFVQKFSNSSCWSELHEFFAFYFCMNSLTVIPLRNTCIFLIKINVLQA